jgi:hypothetical protein
LDPVNGLPIPNPDWKETAPSRIVIGDLNAIADAAHHGFTSESIVRAIAKTGRACGATTCHSDQFEKYSLGSAISKAGFNFVPHTWTAPLKERAVERVRRWLRDGVLILPNDPQLRKEMLSFEERIAPSGALTFRGRQGGHDDRVMLVMLGALVDAEGMLSGSPLLRRRRPLPSDLEA